jgi:glucokinase
MNQTASETEKIVGIEVSNFEMKAVCLDAAANITAALQSPLDTKQETAPQLIGFIKEFELKTGYFDRLGIAIPGLLDRKTKRIAYSAQMPEHEKIDLLNELEKVTKLKIFIENDANAAAFGEYTAGAGRGSRNLFYVTLGSGIGGALIFNGKLWRGSSGYAGEFGYMAVNSDGMRLEDVASAENILRRTKIRFHQDHTSSLNRIGEESITIADVVREANNGDDFAQMMLQRTGMYVGMAVADVINLLNIEKIVIGGEIMQAGHFVLDALVRRARELSFRPSFDTVEIVEGELKDNAAAVGVALLARLNGE